MWCLSSAKKTLLIYSILARFKMSEKFTEFPKTIEDFGYKFNEEGKLRQIDKKTGAITDQGFDFNVSNDSGYNQRHYEALGEAITDHVYNLLEEKGMSKIYIPDDIPKNTATFFYSTAAEIKNPKKLLILIHGSGVVRAGQWARSLIINHSLDSGTQIPYIEMARKHNYEVISTNTNDNYRLIDGVHKSILGNNSPLSHAVSVWDKYVIGSNPESVAIVAHSYGGVVTMELARKYPEFFKEKVFAIGLTDSVHSSIPGNVGEHLRKIGRNWVTSGKPLDEPVRFSDSDIPRFSAGHSKHEWTSYTCMDAVFKFFESKYNEFLSK